MKEDCDKDCPVCNGATIDDLIDIPSIFDLCLKHLRQWLCEDIEPGYEPKKPGIKPLPT